MAFRRTATHVLILLLVSVSAAIPLSAQTVSGTMQGTVTDRSGGALPGVTITVRNLETGMERVLVTDSSGFYNAPFLPVGKYSVTADLSGFGAIKRTGFRIDLNTTNQQNFVLDPAAVAETITVSADAPRINVTDGEIKQTMRSEEIMTLPSGSQTSFLGLASTFAGYADNPTSGQDNPTLSSGSSVNFNGAGTRGTTFQINGVNNDDSSENQHRQGVALATIKSFQVLTNSYSAEFGRGYGAVVLVQTKSGTNDVSGEVYGYAQEAAYRSRNVLTVSLDHGDRYRRQYGATAGFPIFKDTLFGFVNGDMVEDQGSGVVTRGVFLPSDLALPRLTLGNDNAANRAFQDFVISQFPTEAPNAPSTATRAYQGLVVNDFPDQDYSGRLDYTMTMTNNLTARYQRSAQDRVPGALIPTEPAVQHNRQSNFGLTWTNILSSDTVQEARYGLGLRNTNAQLATGNDTPVIRFSGTGVPTFTIFGNAGAYPILRNQRDQQFVYNISSAKFARHTLKAGTDIRRSRLDDRADNFNRGYWSFGATCGGINYGTGIAAFMAGCTSSYTVAYGPNDLQNLLNEMNFYAEDDWRPTDNLTFNIGVRYERVNAPEEVDNKIDYGFANSDYVDPRLGFAYTPNWDNNRFLRAMTGGNGRFSIRGGYGVYHGRAFQSVFSQSGVSVRFNPPGAISLGFSNSTNLADPTNGFVFVPGTWPTVRVSATFVEPDLQMPETRQWNLTFERQAFWNSKVRLSYLGSMGRNLLQIRYDNLPVIPGAPGSGAAWVVAQDWRCAGTGTVAGVAINATCPVAVPLAANEVSLRVPRNNERRPDARYGTNYVINNDGQSWYHAGQFEWETGQYKGFGGRLQYTFSKTIDTGSEATTVGTGDINLWPSAPGYQEFKRGLSRFDTRHRATFVGSYQLPFFNDTTDWKNLLMGGWIVSSALRWSSGTPFTISDSGAADFDFDGITVSRPVCIDPNWCDGITINSRDDSGTIPKSAFRHPQYGDDLSTLIRRNSYYTDGNESVDLGIYKTFKLPMNTSLMVRLDAFNVFDKVTWWYPVTDFNATNFGALNTTNYTPRYLQFGLRLMF